MTCHSWPSLTLRDSTEPSFEPPTQIHDRQGCMMSDQIEQLLDWARSSTGFLGCWMMMFLLNYDLGCLQKAIFSCFRKLWLKKRMQFLKVGSFILVLDVSFLIGRPCIVVSNKMLVLLQRKENFSIRPFEFVSQLGILMSTIDQSGPLFGCFLYRMQILLYSTFQSHLCKKCSRFCWYSWRFYGFPT